MDPQSASTGPLGNASAASGASRPASPSTRPQRGQPGHARPAHRPLGRPGTRTGRPTRHFGRSNHPPRRGKARVEHQSPAQRKQTIGPIPPPAPDTVRIIPLGGVEEIGRNMTAVEFGDDIFILDCGFAFSEGETPGIDYILPNTGYLEERREKIRGLLISHGHLDHIGGIPYIIDRIGNPTIYTRKLTGMMIKKRQEEFTQTSPVNIREVEKDEVVKLGGATIRFFGVTHTVPDSMGIIVETPYGDVVFTGDIKLNHTEGEPSEEEKREFGIFKEAKGRLIVAMFASHLERLIRVVHFAESYGKKIVIDGRSMRTNIEIAREIKLISYKDDTVVAVENMNQYPPENIIILATGAQGDEFASLARIGNKTHKYIRLTPTDTVVLSSSVIPGN